MTGPDDLRARFARHTVAALVAETASLRPRPGSTVGYATRIALRELGRRAAVPRRPARAPGRADRPARHRPRSRPARPLRRRPRHRRPAPDRRRRPPRTAALRGGLGAPVRRRPDPRILRQAHPPPPQPRRRPPGQPRPVADRDHPDELPPRRPAPTSSGAPQKACPRPRSSAASLEDYRFRGPDGRAVVSRSRWGMASLPSRCDGQF